jgi:site-specific DNA-cytosine methylase
MKVFIDLFSGLGGASAAFDEDPTWCSIKIDNNPELVPLNRGLIIRDLSRVDETIHMLTLMLQNIADEHGIEKVILWMSPPCNEFSFANANRPEFPDLTLLDACIQYVECLNPNYWLIENVRGAKETFTDEIERAPTQEIGPVVLWGHFPLIPIRTRDEWKHRKLNAKGSRTLRQNYRAIIPYPISEGLRDAIDHQQTLDKY